MSKAFNKGQLVTLFGDWDRRGTVYFRNAVVYSCGKKQMVLTDAETGEEIGRHFKPAIGEMLGTFPRMTDTEAHAHAAKVGAWVIEREKAHLDGIMSREAFQHQATEYKASIQNDRIACDSYVVRTAPYSVLRDEVTAKVKATFR